MKLFGYLDDAINFVMGLPSWAQWFIVGGVTVLAIYLFLRLRRTEW